MKNWKRLHKNPSAFSNFWLRETIIGAVRSYFKSHAFHEVETPLLLPQPSTEPFLEVFETQLKFSDGQQERGFLPTSPEFSMKKLLAAGSGSIFQICKSFRNSEGRSSRHNPEFTILELYHVGADYTDVMKDVEGLLLSIANAVSPNRTDLTYRGKTYQLQAPWERLSVAQAFEKYAGIKIDDMLSETKLLSLAKNKGYTIEKDTTWEQVFNQIMFNEIEPHLGVTTPTFLYDYPASQAALSRKKPSDPRFAERFEVFLAGFELGNAFTELTDAQEQRQRCLDDLATRRALGKTDFGMDEDFIEALEFGMPDCSGIAMGLDRIIALFADTPAIADVIFFPVDDLFPPRV